MKTRDSRRVGSIRLLGCAIDCSVYDAVAEAGEHDTSDDNYPFHFPFTDVICKVSLQNSVVHQFIDEVRGYKNNRGR